MKRVTPLMLFLILLAFMNVSCEKQIAELKLRSQQIKLETDQVIKDIKEQGFLTPEQVLKLDELNVKYNRINDKINNIETLWDIGDMIVATVATGTPVSLVWAIFSTIGKRKKEQQRLTEEEDFKKLVNNIEQVKGDGISTTLDWGKLKELNKDINLKIHKARE